MTISYRPQLDWAFLASKAESTRSTDVVTLKQSSSVYASGEILVAEYTETTANSGVFDVPTGKYVKAAGLSRLNEYDTVKVAFNGAAVDATAGDTGALVINQDAEVYASLTSFSNIATNAKSLISAALSAQGIKLR